MKRKRWKGSFGNLPFHMVAGIDGRSDENVAVARSDVSLGWVSHIEAQQCSGAQDVEKPTYLVGGCILSMWCMWKEDPLKDGEDWHVIHVVAQNDKKKAIGSETATTLQITDSKWKVQEINLTHYYSSMAVCKKSNFGRYMRDKEATLKTLKGK